MHDRVEEACGLLGSEKGIGCTERADFDPDDMPEVDLEPFIAVSSSPTVSAPMGAEVTDFREVVRCHDLDPDS